jgi:hypothetical protein
MAGTPTYAQFVREYRKRRAKNVLDAAIPHPDLMDALIHAEVDGLFEAAHWRSHGKRQRDEDRIPDDVHVPDEARPSD